MNIRFPVAADFAFLLLFYSLRKFSFLKLLFFTSFFLYTIVHDFGLNRCEVEEGLNRVDRMSAAIISFVRYFSQIFSAMCIHVFSFPSSETAFDTTAGENFPRELFSCTNTEARTFRQHSGESPPMRELCNLRNVRK